MAMLRKLLTDRFQLNFHREPQELPIDAITIAKGGRALGDGHHWAALHGNLACAAPCPGKRNPLAVGRKENVGSSLGAGQSDCFGVIQLPDEKGAGNWHAAPPRRGLES